MAQMSVGAHPRCLPPSVSVERRLARVARLAQGPQIRRVVTAAIPQREHVVNLSSQSRAPGFQTVLAQGVGSDVAVADLAPGMPVTPVDLRVTLEATVAPLLLTGVLLAETCVGELWAAGVGARAGRLDRHLVLPVPGCGEAPRHPADDRVCPGAFPTFQLPTSLQAGNGKCIRCS